LDLHIPMQKYCEPNGDVQLEQSIEEKSFTVQTRTSI